MSEEKKLKKDLHVATSKIKDAGLGLFASRQFKTGEIIIEYRGELVSKVPKNNSYAMYFKKGVYIDGSSADASDAKYINDNRNGNQRHLDEAYNAKLSPNFKAQVLNVKALCDISVAD